MTYNIPDNVVQFVLFSINRLKLKAENRAHCRCFHCYLINDVNPNNYLLKPMRKGYASVTPLVLSLKLIFSIVYLAFSIQN